MHPQLFLKTFWRMELKPWIFVVMSFGEQYESRFSNIIAPAINSINFDGLRFTPYRVDLSMSGDSILTDIIDGIAHSQLILADVSSVGKDAETGMAYRNGNVMYEVGLALACRQSSEVLLVRDDRDDFLFDVSTIPHMNVDFTKSKSAITNLRRALIERLKEQKYINDARVQLAIAGLSHIEFKMLKEIAEFPPKFVWRAEDLPLEDFGGGAFPGPGRLISLSSVIPRLGAMVRSDQQHCTHLAVS